MQDTEVSLHEITNVNHCSKIYFNKVIIHKIDIKREK